jgi:hypothetical protein
VSTEDFDREFAALLTEAHELANEFYGALTETFANKFPESTVYRVVVGTVPLYEAALNALADSFASLGAVALLRPLIENWIHLRFMVGPLPEMEGADCRALQLELGWAMATERLLRSADPAQLPGVQARVQEVLRLLRQGGCPERPRTYSRIDSDSKKVAKEFGLDWMPGAWQSASQTAHGAGWEWLLRETGSATEWVDPDPEQRAGWLNNLIWIFNQFTQIVFLLIGHDLTSGPALALRERADRLLDHPLLADTRTWGGTRSRRVPAAQGSNTEWGEVS